METTQTYGNGEAAKIHFVNLTKEENQTANRYMEEFEAYLQTAGKEADFIEFMELFGKLCKERKS